MSASRRTARSLIADGLQRLLAVWLMAALTVLVAPGRAARASEHDGVARTAYGEVSANASRRAGISAPSEGDAADDDRGDTLASPGEQAYLHGALASILRDVTSSGALACTCSHVPDSGPRGPPRT